MFTQTLHHGQDVFARSSSSGFNFKAKEPSHSYYLLIVKEENIWINTFPKDISIKNPNIFVHDLNSGHWNHSQPR